MSETNKQIEKFDPSTLMQGVKDRIKSTFVSLIPDEQWEQMVKAEVDGFFTKKDIGYSSSKQYASNFELLVRDEINKEAKKRLVEYLSSPEFQVMWDTNGLPIASEEVKKMFIDNSGAILANMFAGMFANAFQQMKYQIQQQQY